MGGRLGRAWGGRAGKVEGRANVRRVATGGHHGGGRAGSSAEGVLCKHVVLVLVAATVRCLVHACMHAAAAAVDALPGQSELHLGPAVSRYLRYHVDIRSSLPHSCKALPFRRTSSVGAKKVCDALSSCVRL